MHLLRIGKGACRNFHLKQRIKKKVNSKSSNSIKKIQQKLKNLEIEKKTSFEIKIQYRLFEIWINHDFSKVSQVQN